MTKGALLCLGMMVVMAIAGTCDYQDAVHFKSIEENDKIEIKYTLHSPFYVVSAVQILEKK